MFRDVKVVRRPRLYTEFFDVRHHCWRRSTVAAFGERVEMLRLSIGGPIPVRRGSAGPFGVVVAGDLSGVLATDLVECVMGGRTVVVRDLSREDVEVLLVAARVEHDRAV